MYDQRELRLHTIDNKLINVFYEYRSIREDYEKAIIKYGKDIPGVFTELLLQFKYAEDKFEDVTDDMYDYLNADLLNGDIYGRG